MVNCLLQEKDNGWPKVLDIYFENNDTVAFSWEEAITIEDTGMYYLWFVICDDELSAATVRGQTTWKNPTGNLLSHNSQPLQALHAGSVWELETFFTREILHAESGLHHIHARPGHCWVKGLDWGRR